MYRQGDILIEAVSAIPSRGTKPEMRDGRLILAAGEATGHDHSVSALDVMESIVDETGTLFLRFCRDAVVTHQEHKPVVLPPGTYGVTRQREYAPEEIRRVAD